MARVCIDEGCQVGELVRGSGVDFGLSLGFGK